MRRLALALALCALASPALATEPAPEGDQEAMMAEWLKLAQPGEGHQRLRPLVGSFDTVTRLWMGGPDAPATESRGTMESSWILGGRFVRGVSKSTMMGQPYEGVAVTGYNNIRKIYESTWIDTMSTNISFSKGSMDRDGKVLTLYGEMDEPALGVYGRMVRLVLRIEGPDRHVMEMYDLHAGDGYKVFETTYTRKKGTKAPAK
ncbi:MAG: DUF1579 domain-containing protein [Deltaproteobacteria bacterium]|nr:DUF1579 domain-containing protein [Deltaproteobacteria bacterium]